MLDLKALLTKILTRITPTTTTIAAQSGSFSMCGLLICWGTNTQSVSSASNPTWDTTFQQSFAYTPVVFTQIRGTTNPKIFSCVVSTASTTGCTFVRGSTSSTAYNCIIDWVAIGKA